MKETLLRITGDTLIKASLQHKCTGLRFQKVGWHPAIVPVSSIRQAQSHVLAAFPVGRDARD